MAIMTGGEALVEFLRNEGVEYVFGLPGSTQIYFLDALEDCPEIKYILGLHEVVVMGMAEGYSRTSGKAGVVNLHTGSGLAAAMPMLQNAYLGGVPLVITAGQQDTRLLLQEPALSGELVRMAGQFVKWSAEVIYAEDIPMVIRRAFKVAMHPPTGPVFISLPQDILEKSIDFEYAAGASSFTRMRPDPGAVNKAAALLSDTKSPAIIVGSGVTKNEALSEVVRLAELVGARVYQTWMSDVNFPVSHPQYLGDLDIGRLQTVEMLKSVDVLVVVGTPLFRQPFYLPKPLISPGTRVIQVDDNPWQVGKNYPVSAGIEGNIKVSLEELIAALQDKMPPRAVEAAGRRREDIAVEKGKMVEAFQRKARQERDNIPISISRLMQELRDAIPPGTLVVDDCWSCSATLRRSIDFTRPKSFQRSRYGGSIGWGMSGAIGVKLAAPDSPVVAVIGDGSAMWSIQSLWTAAHYDIPVTYIICSNASYNQVKIMKNLMMGEKARGRYTGMDLDEPRIDFCELSRAMGVPGQRVERPEELRGALTSALKSGKTALVEVYIERTA